jgi:hypothetical protein
MADFRDVLSARADADSALNHIMEMRSQARRIGDTQILAILWAAHAICMELRALGVTIDYGNRGVSDAKT